MKEPRCSKCGRRDIEVTATAKWDIFMGRWQMSPPTTTAFCWSCEAETDIKWCEEED